MRKTSTRILSAILAVMMLVGLVPMALTSSAAFNDTSIKFDENGEFTLIQITDIQENTEVHETTLALIAKAMNKYNPDMVVFTGDNVESGMDESEFKTCVSQFMAPIINAGVRYAVTFGNHDDEDRSIVNTAWDKQSQYNYYVGMSSLAIDFDEPSLSGVGTGAIPIYSNDGSRVAFCVFPIDSGTYDSNDDYDHVKTDQINWYASESARLAQLNNGNPVPTLTFQHIPVPEIYSNLLQEVPNGTAGAVQGTGQWQNKYYILDPNNSTITGVMQEGPCPAAINNGQYQGWLNVGNHVGAFFGHDHTNTFMGTDANGITMGYCKAATLEAYHAADEDPALRVFNIKEDGTYTTQSVSYAQMQVEDAEDYEHDVISGTPTVPEVLYVGAGDNSIAKQELGTSIQLQSLNHKTQAMYANDLTITIDLDKTATNVKITPQAGINLSGVTITEGELTKTYTWKITGGTASAGTAAEFKIEYDHAGNHYAQYAYSYVDNIKTPAGHYVFSRNYRGSNRNTQANWNTQCYVMTVLGPNVYGNARSTTDIDLRDTYEDDGTTVGNWTNAPAGYYNYTLSEDGGFVQKDTSYGINFMSPSRVRIHDTFPRFTQAGSSPVATVYVDRAEHETLTSVGVFFNFWRHQTNTNNITTTFTTAFKQGDVGYAVSDWSSGTVNAAVASTQNGNVTLAAARGSNITNNLVGATLPANGTTITAITQGYSYINNNYETHHYTYVPVLLKFVTYDKTELRALLNAERTANRQLEDDLTYRTAFKEAYKQIQKPNTTQADIDNAKIRLEKAIEKLSFTGTEISGNGEYYMNATVPSKLYVAGSGYGLSAQPKGTTIQPQIINYRTRQMIDYSNFQVKLPNGATNALVEVINQNTGVAMTYTWDAATASGKVTGGTANVGDTITYKFTYELAGKQYIQYEASTVTDAPQASGWLTFIRRTRQYAWEAHTSQQSLLYFAPEGVPAEGIQYEALQGNAGYDNAYYGVNLTNFDGEGSQKVSGFGINSWTGPGRQNQGGWYAGTNGDNDTADEGYRAKFNLFFDSSVASNITDAKVMFVAQGLGSATDESQGIEQQYETYYQGQGNHGSYGTDLGNLNSAAINIDGAARGNSKLSNDVGDSFYKYLTVPGLGTGNYTYYTYMWNKTNDGSRALTCHYSWHINITTVDKTELRNAVAAEDEMFRQLSDGYSDANGKWTAYVNALAKAKGAVQDSSLTAAENEAYATALQTAVDQLEYVPADYTKLQAKVDEIRGFLGVDPETGANLYEYRPHPDVDPLYYAREEYYPWYYFRSTNETDIPINNINWNLDIRYQAEVDTYLELVEIGWESAQLRDADYTEVDALLENKNGTNPNGSFGGLTIKLPEIDKYAAFEDLENRNLNFELYTTESYNAWANACAPAMTNRSLKMPDQPTVDGYRDALQTAYNNLELKSADYTQLNQTIADATANIDSTFEVVDPSNSANNYSIDYYQAERIALLRAKIAEKKEGLYILQQEEVDVLNAEIDAIYVTLGNYLNEADFKFAFEQMNIKATYEDEHEKYYTAESWQRLLDARAAVDEAYDYGYMAGEQVTVNALAQEVYDARVNLEYNKADYTQVNKWLAEIAAIEYTKNDYKNWADLQAVVDSVETGLDITKQAEVDGYAAALETAYKALALKDADYTKLNEQITIATEIIANQNLYTPGSYTNFLVVYNPALEFYMAEPKVDIHHQELVDEQEAALIAAIEALEYVDADIEPLREAELNYYSVDYYAYEAEYTTDSDNDGVIDVYEDVDAAYQAAAALLAKYDNGELDIRNNAEIQAAADTLNNAIANLPALYASVDWEIEQIPETYYTTPEMYTAESKKALDDALAAVDRNLKIGDQEKVEEMAIAIYEAVLGLEEVNANLTALKDAIAAADAAIAGVDKSTFTADSWAAFEDAYAAAATLRDEAPLYSEQDTVDAATAELIAATAALTKKGADYTALDKAIAQANGLDKDDWTPETWANLESALAAANAVDKNLTIDGQATIDAAAKALNDAIANLKSAAVPCNYAALDAAIAAAAKADTANCTSASVAEFNAALAAAQAVARDLVVDEAGANQKTIDDAAARLNKAIADLTKLGNCDYTALDAAIAAAATADTANCTSASVAEFNAALAAAKAVEKNLIADEAGANQATIDNAAARLNKAITGLTKLGNCDYTALDAAIAAYEAKVADKALYANWAEYEAAYNAAKAVARDMIADEAGANQKAIDNAAAALNAVVLTYKAADYSAVDAAKAAAAKVDASKYTAASVKAVNDAVAAVVTGYDITKQAQVDAMAKAINDAIAKLAPLGVCNYAALDAAIAAYEAKAADKALYTNWADYEAAYNAAKAIARDMIADEAGANQKAIDNAAAALNAVVLTYKAADYSAVDAAKATIPADMSTALYTAASVKAVNDAVNAVVYGLDITKQAQVDAYAAAIADAVAKLAPLGTCDYTALDAAIAKTPAKAADAYSTVTWNAYTAALAAAKAVARDMIADEAGANQAAIDAATAKLVEAFNALADKEFCDYSALQAAVNNCAKLDADEEYYDATDVAEWKAAYNAAQAILAADKLEKTADNQAIIDAAAETLYEKYDDLYEIYLDLSVLEDAIDAYGEHKIDNEIERYEADTWAAYEAALAAAQAALVRLDVAPDTAANRAEIAKVAEDLKKAYEGLKLITGYCDYSLLEEAVLYCSELDADEDYYDAADLAAWKAALAEAQKLLDGEPLYLTAENQAKIDDAAEALFAAYDELYELYLDLSVLEDAIDAYGEHKVDNEIERYEADTWAAYEAALEAAQAALVRLDVAPDTAANRAEIAKLAEDLKKAYEGLKLITGYCDYSLLEEAVLYCSELDATEDYYDAAELAQWKEVLAIAKDLLEDDKLYLTAENQAYIDSVAELLIKEYTDLYELYLDVSELEAAVDAYGEDKIENEIERYTPDSWAAYEAALEAAQAALVRLDVAPDTAANRAEIAKLAQDLKLAYDNLRLLGDCDYSELNAAIADYEDKLADKDLYANWAEYEAAYNAAQDVDRYMIDDADGVNQAKIDAAADALNAVVLVYKAADYSAVDAAIATIPADLKSGKYTDDSVKAVEDAVAAVVEGLDITKQAEVDAYAAAIADAVAKLTVAELPLALKAKEGSTTIIDRENGFIYGLSCAGVDAYSEYEFIEDLLAQNFVEIEGDGRLEYTYVGDNTVLGTGAKVEFINNKTGEVVETYYIVIFGDIDGDGTVTLSDASDAIDYFAWNDCDYDYEDFTIPAVFAADIDNDGAVTLSDFAISNDYLGWNSDFIPQVR